MHALFTQYMRTIPIYRIFSAPNCFSFPFCSPLPFYDVACFPPHPRLLILHRLLARRALHLCELFSSACAFSSVFLHLYTHTHVRFACVLFSFFFVRLPFRRKGRGSSLLFAHHVKDAAGRHLVCVYTYRFSCFIFYFFVPSCLCAALFAGPALTSSFAFLTSFRSRP